MTIGQQPIIGLLADIVRCARTGDYGNAALLFNRCALHLQRHLQTMGNEGGPQHGETITQSLRTMLLLLERNDWVALADVIEYEFIPLWKKAFPGAE